MFPKLGCTQSWVICPHAEISPALSEKLDLLRSLKGSLALHLCYYVPAITWWIPGQEITGLRFAQGWSCILTHSSNGNFLCWWCRTSSPIPGMCHQRHSTQPFWESLASQITAFEAYIWTSLGLKDSYHITQGQVEAQGSTSLGTFWHSELFVQHSLMLVRGQDTEHVWAQPRLLHTGVLCQHVQHKQTPGTGHSMSGSAFIPWCFGSADATAWQMIFQHQWNKGGSRNN